MALSKKKQFFLLLLPWLLNPTMMLVFAAASNRLGANAGYLAGFAIYWLLCLLLPRWLLGAGGVSDLFRERRPLLSRENWLAVVLLCLTAVGAFFVYFLPRLAQAGPVLLLATLPTAILNGLCEEILWRGLYVRSFPQQPWLAVVYPALGFSLWHLAPQLVYPAAGGIWGLVVSAFFLGLVYGFAAWRSGSMKWSGISHSLNGVLAFSGAIAPALLFLLGMR